MRKPSGVTFSGLSGSPAAASTPAETTSAWAPLLPGPVGEVADGVEPGVVAGAGLEAEVPVRSLPGARSVLAVEADVVREPACGGVDVDGPDEHVVARVEDLLRAVAVVRVEVHDGYDVEMVPQSGRGRRGVVQVARPAVGRARHVVPRRTAAGVGRESAVGDVVGRGDSDVDGCASGRPRAGAHGGHRVVGVVPRPCPGRGGDGERAAGGERRMREDVRDDLGLARISGESGGVPVRPGGREEVEQVVAVDGGDGIVGLLLGVEDGRAGGRERLADRLGAGGNLRRRRAHADPRLRRRIVQPVLVAPDDWHP